MAIGISKQTETSFVRKITFSEKAQEASCLVAELVAHKRKSQTVGESLIMPPCKFIMSKMLGQDAAREIEKVPLSNSTISQRIDIMSRDAQEVFYNKLKNNRFSIQVDDSTDFTNKCHVICKICKICK
jgi:hypothetical protein